MSYFSGYHLPDELLSKAGALFPRNLTFNGQVEQLNVKTPTLYSCPKCGKSYEWRASLYNHVNFGCGTQPKFQCSLCPYKTRWKGNLRSHFVTHRNVTPLYKASSDQNPLQ